VSWRPHRALVVLLATVVGVLITARLGLWQLDRAAQKIALQTALQQRSTLPALGNVQLAAALPALESQFHRSVQLRGTWMPERTVFLDNRPMAGRVGFDVVTPLQLMGRGDAVLVQRGWVPRDLLDRTKLPTVPTPLGEVEVVGRLAPAPSRLYEFVHGGTGLIRQNLDPGDFAREIGVALRPVAVLQTQPPASGDDGLLRQWAAPAVDVQKHHGYAFQWFALCALMSGLYVWFQVIRPRWRR
jgi:surfeit locus 1 family protein